MKNHYLFIFLLLTFNVYSQDIIVKTDGSSIKAKVEEVGEDVIKYHKYDNLEGPVYSIKKEEILIINFENGTFEIINSKTNFEENFSLEETKELIVNKINKYSFAWQHEFNKYSA